MNKKYVVISLIFIMCMQLLCACGKEQKKTEEKINVGVLCYDLKDTFISELTEDFRNEIENQNKGATVSIRDAKGSQIDQNDQVRELIDSGCNVLCVNLVDRTSPSEIIDMAKENDIPLIFFNREPVAEDMRQWENIYYVGAKAKESGDMQGELAAEAIKANPDIDRNHDGKIQYVIMEGEPGHQDVITRTENSVNTLKNEGIELEKLDCGIANWNRAQAENRMLQIISEYGNEVELVLANNDDMALGALDAYKGLYYSKDDLPIFFGVDGTKAGLEGIKSGDLTGTVYNDKEGQAEAMARLTEALVSGKGMDSILFENGRYIYLPYAKITIDNVDDFIDKNE